MANWKKAAQRGKACWLLELLQEEKTQEMTATDWIENNRRVVEEFRANGGPLILLTIKGAKSGQPREVQLAYFHDRPTRSWLRPTTAEDDTRSGITT